MGFNHFDTTKVGVVNMLFTYPATIYNIDKYMLGWLHHVCSIMVWANKSIKIHYNIT